MKMKEMSEKAGLKFNIQKTRIMASSPISSWQIDGETLDRVTNFIFWGSKITADGDCSHEIKRQLLLGRKATGESWTIKKAKHWRIDAFELWCCRRLLRVPWSARRSNQSILKEINPEYSLERLMLKFQYFGHLMQRANSLEKTDAGKDWRQDEKGMTEYEMVGWHHWLDGHEFEQALGDGEGQGSLACCSLWGCKESYMTDDWTITSIDYKYKHFWKFMVFFCC